MVAALAGVSRSTVSRVVNSSPRVTADAIAAVTRAIDELGYVPNRAARSLASRRTLTIALVIPENTARFFADPYFSSVIQGIAARLSATEYTLTLLIASETDPEKTRRYLQAGNVDGAIVLSHHTDDLSYVQLARTLPVVFGGRPTNAEGADAYVVDADNIAAAHTATRYLIDHGRTHLATIAGPQNMAPGIDRLEGWRAAAAESGLESELVEAGDFSQAGGADAMRRLLSRGLPLDGLFVASAQMASGALAALRDAGLRVPANVAITTIDDDYFSQNATPALTTIEQPTSLQGATLAENLVKIIEGEDVPRLTIVPTRLIERESV